MGRQHLAERNQALGSQSEERPQIHCRRGLQNDQLTGSQSLE